MGTSRDPISENKVYRLLSGRQMQVGTFNGPQTDLRSAMAGAHDLREDVTNVLLAIDGDIGAGSTVDITIQHRTTATGAWVAYATLAQIVATDGLYIAQINNLRRFVRAVTVVAGAAIDRISIIGFGNRARRMPVSQPGTELAVTLVSAP